MTTKPAHLPRTVLITGATGDFGRAMAQRFAAVGSQLILTGRNENKLQALANELKVPTHSFTLDVRDRRAIEQAYATIPAAFHNIDLLINNAGLALGTEPAQGASLDDWQMMVDTNIGGLIIWTHMVLKDMVARQHGHIINMGSTAGSYAYPGGHVYCASKAFVKQFSLSLRADLIGTKVRVTNIEPGMVATDFSLVRFKGDAERAAKVYENTTPLTAADVAESVFWAATLPSHVNINRIEMMPVTQGPALPNVHRYV